MPLGRPNRVCGTVCRRDRLPPRPSINGGSAVLERTLWPNSRMTVNLHFSTDRNGGQYRFDCDPSHRSQTDGARESMTLRLHRRFATAIEIW